MESVHPPLRVILTGATGMVGEGVLHECLLSPRVEKILSVSRKPSGVTHPKFSEVILSDFFNPRSVEASLMGYDACFFCLGVSSIGISKKTYEKMTYELTMTFARTLVKLNPDMIFSYISGSGTDSTEKGKTHWARIKGKTENALQQLGFRKTFLFRPALLTPTKGLKNTLGIYKWFAWLVPVMRTFFPNGISSLAVLGKAMIQASAEGHDGAIIEVKEMKTMIKES